MTAARTAISPEPRCIVFAANRGYALSSSRLKLIIALIESGWKVVLATADDAEARELEGHGARLEPVTFNRGGLAPVVDYKAYRRLEAVYRRWRPALVHHFHAKPVILGTLAARRMLGPSVRIVNTITGLGHAFVASGLSARLVGLGYRIALPDADATIFQNRDDQALFIDRGWVRQSSARLIMGSGVDIERFAYVDRSRRGAEGPIIVMLARLLRQKGVPELVEVARRVRRRWPEARFVLAGEEDRGHPDAVDPDWLREQSDVEYRGRLSDVVPLLAEADVFLFPSYYREGVPRVVLEAAAAGLPAVAFDVPGVREAVRGGETGYLVPARDIDALVDRIEQLIEDPTKRLQMGRAARRFVEAQFDIRVIQDQFLRVYGELGIRVS